MSAWLRGVPLPGAYGAGVRVQYGTLAGRPAAADAPSMIYVATDNGLAYYSDAVTWATVPFSTLTASDVPDVSATYQARSERAAASGYPTLDAGTKVPTAQLGSGTADGTTFLRGDQSWATPTGTGGMTKLFDSTLGSAAASIDTGAGGIATGYDALTAFIYARTDEAVVFSTLTITLNDDTGASYNWEQVRGTSASASASGSFAQSAFTFITAGASEPASVFGALQFWFPAYAQTTGHKSGTMTRGIVGGTAANSDATLLGVRWASTAAISRMKVAAPATKNLVTGSRLLIYGV